MITSLLLLVTTQVCFGQSPERVAVIMEMRVNHGDIRIGAANSPVFVRPVLLQSLYPGTRIEVSGDASVTLVFIREAKSLTIEAKNSPYEIKAPGKQGSVSSRFAALVLELVGTQESNKSSLLGTRGPAQAPALISPRNSKLMSDLPTFHWVRPKQGPVSLKVSAPEGPIWRADDLAGGELKYPPTAPRLKPGTEYSWEIVDSGATAEKVTFTILTPAELRAVEEKLTSLKDAKALSKSTQAILKALLFKAYELYHDAREELLQAIQSDPREPTLRLLLGEIYEKTGLYELSREQYESADEMLKE